MFSKILIANRGEIACRIIKSARKMGIQTIAIFSDSDANALHVKMADEAVHVGPSPVADSYLQIDRIINAAKTYGAEAIHPGYGFLSENPEFAEKIVDAGMIFIGPHAGSIRSMGLKDQAKHLMAKANVPIVPGYHGQNQDADFLASEAKKIGYPILIKARAGGGGKGMRLVEKHDDFSIQLASAQREGQSSFGDAHVLIEKYIQSPRHIEVQVFGDTHGNVVHLYERDCSMQRRHQKVIEEAPAPDMTHNMRKVMTEAAVAAAKAINYHGAGTIEFIVDGSDGLKEDGFWFMEMNTRLQVEHPVTEAITGQDLVEWQLRVASGERLPLTQDEIPLQGHSMEARIYAEDPSQNFKPTSGQLVGLVFDKDARIDTGVASGDIISPYYDPMIAKITTFAEDRKRALKALDSALKNTFCAGTASNLGFLQRLASDQDFEAARLDTTLIGRKLDVLGTIAPSTCFDMLAAVIVGFDLDLTQPRLGWQLWQTPQIKLQLLHRDEVFDVTLTLDGNDCVTVEALADTKTFKSVRRVDDIITANSDDERLKARATKNGNSVHVKSAADLHTFTLIDPLDVSDASHANSDHVIAPMTGTVTVLSACVGDRVSEGTPLLVLEAMKMEHTLNAPKDGIIKELYCSVGIAVSEGATLVSFEKSEE